MWFFSITLDVNIVFLSMQYLTNRDGATIKNCFVAKVTIIIIIYTFSKILPTGISPLFPIMIIANVSSQTDCSVERQHTVPAGILLHGLLTKNK